MAYVDGVVGNSSSGLLEAPTFRVGTINIGDRQRGRIQAESVINCVPTKNDIAQALRRLYSPEFRSSLAAVKNPYGDGGASARIVESIMSAPLDSVLKKPFHNLSNVF